MDMVYCRESNIAMFKFSGAMGYDFCFKAFGEFNENWIDRRNVRGDDIADAGVVDNRGPGPDRMNGFDFGFDELPIFRVAVVGAFLKTDDMDNLVGFFECHYNADAPC